MTRRLAILAFTLLLVGSTAVGQTLTREKLRWMNRHPSIKKIEIKVLDTPQFFSDGDIRSQMYSVERSFMHALRGTRSSRLQRETLQRDTLELRYLYMKNGFLNVAIKEEFNRYEKDTSAVKITVSITEGRRYHYGDKTVSGNYPREYNHDLNRIAGRLKTGKPIDYFKLAETSFEMQTYLANRGFPYADIGTVVDTTLPTDTCPIKFNIDTDSAVTFGDITVTGANHYPQSVALRELKIKPGATYRLDDILDSRRRLYESGYYTSFTLNQIDTSANRLNPDFSLRLRERKRYYVSTTTGAVAQSDLDDLAWVFTLGGGKRNFLKSRRLGAEADYFFRIGEETRLSRHVYTLKFTEPWLLGTRTPLTLGGEWRPRLQSEKQDYDIESWSVSATTRKNYGLILRAELGFEFEKVDIFGLTPEEIAVVKQDTATERRKIYLTVRRDTRDDIFVPRTGSVTDISAEYIGGFLGGDDNFTRLQFTVSTYDRIWPGWISATRVRLGWVGEFGKSQFVPAEDRFYLGGANTIRGFGERTLGPLAADASPIGANYILIFNQEFRWKTIQVFNWMPLGIGRLMKTFPLWQSIFFDMGNGFETFEDMRSENQAFAYGTGIQLLSPAGPIRVDYARRIKTDRYDFDDHWHFTILYAF